MKQADFYRDKTVYSLNNQARLMKYDEMKQQASDEQNRIELRSEKVRNIIGQMPSFLIRWGNTILLIIFILLLATGYFFYCQTHILTYKTIT